MRSHARRPQAPPSVGRVLGLRGRLVSSTEAGFPIQATACWQGPASPLAPSRCPARIPIRASSLGQQSLACQPARTRNRPSTEHLRLHSRLGSGAPESSFDRLGARRPAPERRREVPLQAPLAGRGRSRRGDLREEIHGNGGERLRVLVFSELLPEAVHDAPRPALALGGGLSFLAMLIAFAIMR